MSCLPIITHEARTDTVIETFMLFFIECEKSADVVFVSTILLILIRRSVKLTYFCATAQFTATEVTEFVSGNKTHWGLLVFRGVCVTVFQFIGSGFPLF